MIRSTVAVLAGTLLAACGAPTAPAPEATMNNTVDLRHLVETEVAGNGIERYPLEGVEIPTPSDAQSRYEVLRQRRTAAGTITRAGPAGITPSERGASAPWIAHNCAECPAGTSTPPAIRTVALAGS